MTLPSRITLMFAASMLNAMASAQSGWMEMVVPGQPQSHVDPQRFSFQAEAASEDYVLPRVRPNHFYVQDYNDPVDMPPWRLVVASLAYNDWNYDAGTQTIHATVGQHIDAYEDWETLQGTNAGTSIVPLEERSTTM